MALVIDDQVREAWGRLTKTSHETGVNWISCGYSAKGKLEFRAEGRKGMQEFLDSLPADEISWGAFLVTGVDDRGNTISRRPKYILLKYMPETVPTMKRARSGGHKGAVKQIFDAHIDIEIEDKNELTEEVLIAKLRASGGAHAPNSYEFTPGVLIKVPDRGDA